MKSILILLPGGLADDLGPSIAGGRRDCRSPRQPTRDGRPVVMKRALLACSVAVAAPLLAHQVPAAGDGSPPATAPAVARLAPTTTATVALPAPVIPSWLLTHDLRRE